MFLYVQIPVLEFVLVGSSTCPCVPVGLNTWPCVSVGSNTWPCVSVGLNTWPCVSVGPGDVKVVLKVQVHGLVFL